MLWRDLRDHVVHVEGPAIDVGGAVQWLESVLAIGAGEHIDQVCRQAFASYVVVAGAVRHCHSGANYSPLVLDADAGAYDPVMESALLLLKIDRLLREDAWSPSLDSILGTQKAFTFTFP